MVKMLADILNMYFILLIKHVDNFIIPYSQL